MVEEKCAVVVEFVVMKEDAPRGQFCDSSGRQAWSGNGGAYGGGRGCTMRENPTLMPKQKCAVVVEEFVMTKEGTL